MLTWQAFVDDAGIRAAAERQWLAERSMAEAPPGLATEELFELL